MYIINTIICYRIYENYIGQPDRKPGIYNPGMNAGLAIRFSAVSIEGR